MSKRIIASLIHLCVSLFLVLSVLTVVILLWYPRPYFDAMGVGKMLLILVCVDVTIGPLITLIIFNPAKKTLKFDLAIIAILQLIALMYGINTVFSGRPVYVVYNVDMFTVVSAVDIPNVELVKAHINSLPLTGPKIVGARLPVDNKERERILYSAMRGGPDLPQMPQYYLSYEALASEVKARMLPLDVLIDHQPKSIANETRSLISDAVSRRGLRADEVAFVPMRAKVQDFTVLVRRSDSSIVSILPIDPWRDK